MVRSTTRAGIPRFLIVVFGLCGCFWTPRASLAAQRGSWEIGLDMGAEFTSREIDAFVFTDPDGNPLKPPTRRETLVDVPQGAFRAGYFFTDALSLESTLGLSWTMENPDTRVTDWQARVGLDATYAVAPSARVSPFLSSGVSARFSRGEVFGFATSTQSFGIPLECGVRIRVGASHSIRIQSGVIASFTPDGTDGVFWTVPVRIGWSLSTKAAPGRSLQ